MSRRSFSASLCPSTIKSCTKTNPPTECTNPCDCSIVSVTINGAYTSLVRSVRHTSSLLQVRLHGHHLVLEQERLIRRENQTFTLDTLLSRVHRPQRIRSGGWVHPSSIRLEEQVHAERSVLPSHVRDGHAKRSIRLRRCHRCKHLSWSRAARRPVASVFRSSSRWTFAAAVSIEILVNTWRTAQATPFFLFTSSIHTYIYFCSLLALILCVLKEGTSVTLFLFHTTFLDRFHGQWTKAKDTQSAWLSYNKIE